MSSSINLRRLELDFSLIFLGDLCTRRAVCAQAILPLSATYLGDPGCFLLYFLNYVALDPGESVYIPPKVLFTYLKGGNTSFDSLLGPYLNC